jgi:hypothetical protein
LTEAGVKKLIVAIILVIIVFFIGLNTSMIANQAQAWVKEHPKDPEAPNILFKSARWCDILGDNNKAKEVYWQIYEQYKERKDLCVASLYYCAEIQATASSARKLASTYLEIILREYPSEGEWPTKAKKLYDEVNYVH